MAFAGVYSLATEADGERACYEKLKDQNGEDIFRKWWEELDEYEL